ncbi:hypothetical protein [Marinicellulosiphila megalodicopiae]|uniref:hypothetical protein n=1 Tax=Marinicellulosiphila megalodicopiae TaxID=2724896 RepID=UPI003BAE1D39
MHSFKHKLPHTQHTLKVALIPFLTLFIFTQSCQPVIIDTKTDSTDITSETKTKTETETETETEIETPNIQCNDVFTEFKKSIFPVLSSTCESCHISNSAFETPYKFNNQSSELAFLSTLDYLYDNPNANFFVLKPTNQVMHNGGYQIDTDSNTESLFSDFIHLTEQLPFQCTSTDLIINNEVIDARLSNITRLSLSQNYQKALFTLTGKTESLTSINQITTEQQFKQSLRSQLSEDGFTAFLINGANDRLLTLKFANSQSFAIDSINSWIYQDIYTKLGESDIARDLAQKAMQDLIDASTVTPPEDDPKVIQARLHYQTLADENWDMRKKINRAIAEEPLRLIDHVVQNDRPYTEILTADYMMVNGYSNQAFNGEHAIKDLAEDDHETWAEGYIASHRFLSIDQYGEIAQADKDFSQYEQGHVPNSGILSSPAFLMRFPSTDTNKNRARARWTYKFFLGVDIERLVQRAQDPDELAKITDPGSENSSCYGCHIIMDPVAGAFQSFGDSGAYLETAGTSSLPWDYIGNHESYEQDDRWYRSNIPPGLNGKNINTQNLYGKIEDTQFVDPIQWLGKHIINDKRFASATVEFWYPAVMSHDLLLKPEDTDSPAFLAYQIQQNIIKELTDQFVQSNYDLKTLLIEMTLTDLFAAKQFKNASSSHDIEFKNLGLGNLLTPEQIDNKMIAITGKHWTYNWSLDTHKLIDDYYLFLGGIDSDKITERTREINTMMVQTIERMAQEMSCKLVLDEFNADLNTRKLFTFVNAKTIPELPLSAFLTNDNLNEQVLDYVEVSQDNIIQQIQYLVHLFWNQQLSADDPEVLAIYQLWQNIWQSRLENATDFSSLHNSDNENTELQEFCEVNWDELNWDDVDYSKIENIKANLGEFYNPEHTIRPWSAILIYLMTDYFFMYQ